MKVFQFCSTFLCLLLLSLSANAQRLNPEGLKMVSRVSVNDNKTIEFKYDSTDRLIEVIHTYTEPHGNHTVYKEVITKNGNAITQKSYRDGRPFNRHENDSDNFFTYEYVLNSDGRIGKFYIYDHSWAKTIGRLSVELVYKDGVLDELKRTHSYNENGLYFRYDYPGVVSHIKLYYAHQGFYTQKIEYGLTDEQYQKYAPDLTEDELNEGMINGVKQYEGKLRYDRYEYSPDIKNDTNIGLNGLELMERMGVSSGGDALDNILYYTEWVGLREKNMLMNVDNKKKKVVYQYDDKGNIIKIKYRYGEKMRRYRANDMDKDLMTISIEYVTE